MKKPVPGQAKQAARQNRVNLAEENSDSDCSSVDDAEVEVCL